MNYRELGFKELKGYITNSFKDCLNIDCLKSTKKYNHEKFDEVHEIGKLTDSEYDDLVTYNDLEFHRFRRKLRGDLKYET
jgi:hypothetical protein